MTMRRIAATLTITAALVVGFAVGAQANPAWHDNWPCRTDPTGAAVSEFRGLRLNAKGDIQIIGACDASGVQQVYAIRVPRGLKPYLQQQTNFYVFGSRP